MHHHVPTDGAVLSQHHFGQIASHYRPLLHYPLCEQADARGGRSALNPPTTRPVWCVSHLASYDDTGQPPSIRLVAQLRADTARQNTAAARIRPGWARAAGSRALSRGSSCRCRRTCTPLLVCIHSSPLYSSIVESGSIPHPHTDPQHPRRQPGPSPGLPGLRLRAPRARVRRGFCGPSLARLAPRTGRLVLCTHVVRRTSQVLNKSV